MSSILPSSSLLFLTLSLTLRLCPSPLLTAVCIHNESLCYIRSNRAIWAQSGGEEMLLSSVILNRRHSHLKDRVAHQEMYVCIL